MARLLRRTLAGTGLSVVSQGGRLYCLEELEGGTRRFQTKPDILVKRGTATTSIIDTKWKRIAPRIDDPRQGVAQADVYQLMAYGRVYQCPRLMLLYPHHRALGASPALTLHRVAAPGVGDVLSIASVDVSSHGEARRCLAQLFVKTAEDVRA